MDLVGFLKKKKEEPIERDASRQTRSPVVGPPEHFPLLQKLLREGERERKRAEKLYHSRPLILTSNFFMASNYQSQVMGSFSIISWFYAQARKAIVFWSDSQPWSLTRVI